MWYLYLCRKTERKIKYSYFRKVCIFSDVCVHQKSAKRGRFLEGRMLMVLLLIISNGTRFEPHGKI